MTACGAQMLLCLLVLAALPSDWLLPVVIAQEDTQDPTDAPVPEATVADDSGPTSAPDPLKMLPATDADETLGENAAGTRPDSPETTQHPKCREERFPCTRLYSVHKPVKQCISYLCVTSVRRTYMINKEICSRIVCKEDEAMQEEICRQLAGLPPRRLRRSSWLRGPLCRQTQDQPPNGIEAQ